MTKFHRIFITAMYTIHTAGDKAVITAFTNCYGIVKFLLISVKKDDQFLSTVALSADIL